MKNFLLFLGFALASAVAGWGQDADWDNVKWNLTQLCQETYNAAPFSGVKLTTFEGTDFLMSVGLASAAKGRELSTLSRMAEMKARRSVVEFMQGTVITSESLFGMVEITENGKAEKTEYFADVVAEQSQGFVNGLEVLTAFDDKKNDTYVVFLFSPLEK